VAAQGTAPAVRRQGGVKHLARVLALTAVLAILGACSTGASPSPITGAEAVAAVLAQDTRFAGLEALDPSAIGRSGWFEIEPAADGAFTVRITLGWGDCPAGCTNRHQWQYAVSSAGAVTLVGQSGDPLPDPAGGVRGTVTSGPGCPVVTDPPDPSCADRPVAGAVIVVTNAAGVEVARSVSAVDGTYSVALDPGSWTLTPQPVEGLMGTPAPQTVQLEIGAAALLIDFGYDTGIR
jgi:hypothetical protein